MEFNSGFKGLTACSKIDLKLLTLHKST